MELKERLLSFSSFGKKEGELVAKELIKTTPNLESLVALFVQKQDNVHVIQRAAWVFSKCIDIEVELVKPHIGILLDNLNNTPSDAVKRNTLRVLQNVELPEEHWDQAVDKCFAYLEDRKEAVAIQVFAMTILANIVSHYPELKNELKILLEDRMEYGSAGFQSRAKKILKQLE